MKPDRTNYEIWFTDWMDGILTSPEINELKHFLDENPDLREEAGTFSVVSLKPEGKKFEGKEKIKKSITSYSASQFEHLCIASLENDLRETQITELKEIIGSDEDKKKTFELISRLKLTPPTATFSRKSRVKRLTMAGKVIRLAMTGLSVAAAAALLVLVIKPRTNENYNVIGGSAGNEAADTILIKTPALLIQPVTLAAAQPAAEIHDISPASPEPAALDGKQAISEFGTFENILDSTTFLVRATPINALPVPDPGDLTLTGIQSGALLMGFNPENISPFPFFDDGRSNVERFLARFFHERIMKDTISPARPVERYELAEASLSGLNRLFGWELALQKNTDENGEIRSYYFSSRLLKFNAPVKKSAKEL
jgi:hypothetical protein